MSMFGTVPTPEQQLEAAYDRLLAEVEQWRILHATVANDLAELKAKTVEVGDIPRGRP